MVSQIEDINDTIGEIADDSIIGLLLDDRVVGKPRDFAESFRWQIGIQKRMYEEDLEIAAQLAATNPRPTDSSQEIVVRDIKPQVYGIVPQSNLFYNPLIKAIFPSIK